MINEHGQSCVAINKDQLAEQVAKNRLTHEREYAIARQGYRAELRKRLLGAAADLTEGKEVNRKELIDIPEPRSHASDYNRILRMLEMSVDPIALITDDDFRRYVLDEWDWSAAFKGSTSAYSVSR